METKDIDKLNNMINSEEIKSCEKNELKVAVRKIEQLLSIVKTLEKLKEIFEELEYNEHNLYLYDECEPGSELNNQIIKIYSIYQRINRRYFDDLRDNNINISNVDFDGAIEKLNISKSKLEKILENK